MAYPFCVIQGEVNTKILAMMESTNPTGPNNNPLKNGVTEPKKNTEPNLPEKKTSRRGFASMTKEQQKQIASKGGQAAHKRGVAHQWNADEAREAGKKGGEKVSRNRQHMAEIGRKGGKSSSGGGRKKIENAPDDTKQDGMNTNEKKEDNSYTE